MKIERTEAPTGGPNRTRREEIVSLFTGPRGVEPEQYWDFSESEGWPWDSDPTMCTWDIQLAASRGFMVPFEALDTEAAGEQAGGSDEQGGVYTYPFSNIFLPMGDGDDDGDLNSSNFDRKVAAFIAKYGKGGKPRGGTEVMEAILAADAHFLGTKKEPGEFYDTPRDERPIRARVVWTDGMLNDAGKFQKYLEQAKLSDEGYGSHGEWDEAWAIAITGEGAVAGGGNPGKDAYNQYLAIAKDHPWIHPYYFERVVNPDEISEDMAIAVVPTAA